METHCANAPQRRGRFAPSPTADLHLGNLRTALLAWLQARSRGAEFLLRIEDLDRGRVRDGLAERQLEDLRAIGLDWDGDPVRQCDRIELYEAALEGLILFALLWWFSNHRRPLGARLQPGASR